MISYIAKLRTSFVSDGIFSKVIATTRFTYLYRASFSGLKKTKPIFIKLLPIIIVFSEILIEFLVLSLFNILFCSKLVNIISIFFYLNHLQVSTCPTKVDFLRKIAHPHHIQLDNNYQNVFNLSNGFKDNPCSAL